MCFFHPLHVLLLKCVIDVTWHCRVSLVSLSFQTAGGQRIKLDGGFGRFKQIFVRLLCDVFQWCHYSHNFKARFSSDNLDLQAILQPYLLCNATLASSHNSFLKLFGHSSENSGPTQFPQIASMDGFLIVNRGLWAEAVAIDEFVDLSSEMFVSVLRTKRLTRAPSCLLRLNKVDRLHEVEGLPLS